VYRLIGRLEQGQLADLFRGERVESAEPVVVKLFHPRTSDAAYAKVVADAARQLQGLAHPGVARVLDVGLVDQRLAIVRQDPGRYTLGLALQRLNTREVFLPPALALTLVLELLEVLGAAHGAGVVHGALTPGNVVLGDDGRVAVADFGALAALLAAPALKKAFAGRGRNSYRAPELANGGAATIASDVYALGAITYELLTLREASTGNATVSTRSARLPPPSRLVRRLHSRIDPVIMRALEPSAARRYKACGDFAEGLRDFLAASGGIPPREDLQKFVGELFPNEVQLGALGPVPFERKFELTDVAGVGSFEADAAAPEERPSFSGGYVDDRTPTSDGLPVFTEELAGAAAPTVAEVPVSGPATVPLPVMPAEGATVPLPAMRSEAATMPLPARGEAATVPLPARADASTLPLPEPATTPEAVAPRLTWDAPAAAMPEAGPVPAAPAEPLRNRVRVVEDFGALPAGPKPVEEAPRRQKVAKTLMTFAVPFKREGDPEIPSYEGMEARARRRRQVASALGAMILVGTVSGTILLWYSSQSDPLASLVSYLPLPIQREIKLPQRPLPPPAVGQSDKPLLKLKDFDKLHPDKAFDPTPKPEPEPEAPRPTPKPVATKPVAPRASADCYAAGKGTVGYLSVVSAVAVRVEIDGKRVCTGLSKVPVAVGSHKVRILEPKTKQEFASTTRFEAGKIVKLSPGFQKR
jgi:serine/threonine-protein kinase